MAINQEYRGRTFGGTAPYEVSRVKIAEFADAIGDPNPVFRDPAAAQAAGYPDVIAPPTFAFVVAMPAGQLLADPGLGLNYEMVVVVEQRFTYSRPLCAGDMVTVQAKISDIRAVGAMVLISGETEIRTVDGELVCTCLTILVEREAG